MNRVVAAVEAGRCVVAVAGSLLRDPQVMLELADRSDLPSIALSGPAIAPVQAVGPEAVARAITGPGGVVVLVEPQLVDQPGVQALAKAISRGPHTPTVLVVAKAFNPFMYSSVFRGVAVAHLKGRGKSFFKELPAPSAISAGAAEVEVVAPKKAKKTVDDAPRLHFVGRDDELAELTGMLQVGGPLVVSGPSGIGRSWLVEHAIEAAELERLPDLVLGFGTGADALFARIAEIASAAGSDRLATHLAGPRTPADTITAMLEALQAAEGTANQVMVVRRLEFGIGREGDFFRKSRLELALHALLTHTYPLRIVFQSIRQPVFYTHGAAEHLRRLEVGGVKGRFFNDIFVSYKGPEVPRDKFGPLYERVQGHPMSVRQLAVEMRLRDDGEGLIDNPKYLARTDDRMESLRKVFAKRIERTQAPLRKALSVVAHLRMPADGSMLADLGITRKARLELLSLGLLDMVGTEKDRRYRVHPLVRAGLSFREIADFDLLEQIAGVYARRGENASGVERVAMVQEANRCIVLARRAGDRRRLKYPDNDPLLDSVMGMMRGQRTNMALAETRLREVLGSDPSNSDAHLLKIEFMRVNEAPREVIAGAIDVAIEQAPVPEVFHQAVTWHLGRKARGAAIEVMEKAIAILPDEARLHTRLAALLMRQGRRPEAIESLKRAMEMAPMLPDAYGLLGMARRDEGMEALDDAEQLLREAVRLAPEDPVQTPRLVSLLMARARVDAARSTELRAEVRELLESVVKAERRSPESFVMLAQLTREEGGDPERCAWLLKKARKMSERNPDRNARIALEFALLDLARGDLDRAESSVRELVERDPSNTGVFLALSQVLEARQLYIPAHAEMMRAFERTSPSSVERRLVENELARLQALVQVQIEGLHAPSPAPSALASITPSAPRVIRRRPGGAQDTIVPVGDAAHAEAAPAEAAEEAPGSAEAAQEAPGSAEAAEEAPGSAEAPAEGEAAEDAPGSAEEPVAVEAEEPVAVSEPEDVVAEVETNPA